MRVVIESRLSEIRRVGRLVDDFKARHGLADEDANALHVVLDEVVSNAIRHGLGGDEAHQISVTLDLVGDEIRIEVEDDGVAYDPTQAAAPVLSGSLEERTEGGLGVAFVRALMHAMEYSREGGCNRLVLRRRIARR